MNGRQFGIGTVSTALLNSILQHHINSTVQRKIDLNVYDVLERQGRAAGLPDYIVTTILNQLTVNITYTPLECKRVVANPTRDVA
ncbi:hypothetical protein KIN20_020785, partial [Parelaphostrongylus tenuis]